MMSKFILYLRYLKVNYSPKMLLYFYHYGTSSFSLGLAMPDSWVEDFDQKTIPNNFGFYEIHSSYLVNYFSTLSTLLITAALALVLMLATYLAQKSKSVVQF
mmetsp:Transcript_29045/g.26421  ORF Transcript_29045/g.26421 Transcript_29045/m.26421 type:complete len:102 (+) Transcript_29045:449-754(+)